MGERRAGVIISYFSIFVGIFVTLFFTPFLLSTLGDRGYGLYVLAISLIAYLSIIDLGMSDCIVRFLIKYKVSGDKEGESNFLANMVLVYIILAVATLIFGYVFYYQVNFIFSDSFNNQELVVFKEMLFWIVISVSFTILFNPINAIIIASEKFIFFRGLEIVTYLITTLMMSVYLYYGYEALTMILISVSMSVLTVLIKIFYAFFRLETKIKLLFFSKEEISNVLKYSAPIFIVIIVEQIYWKLDNVIIGSLLGPSLITIYALGLMFHKYFMKFGTAISRVMLPNVVRSIEKGSCVNELTCLIAKVSRIQAFIILLLLSGLILFGKEFIVLWIGAEYSDAYIVLLWVMIPYSLELIGNLRNTVLQVKELYWYRSLILVLLSIINVILTLILIKYYGVIGASASTGLCVLIGYISITYLMSIKSILNVKDYFRKLALGILPAFSLILIAGYFIKSLPVDNWSGFIIKITLFSLVYGFIFYFVGFNKYEKESAKSIILKLHINRIKTDNTKPL